ncbi:MAG: helix-turn-helix domain-containing protein [Pseudomonadota bacterium]
MDRSEDLKEIVRVFAQYGFRKTSMRDLADGLGISRQALYNRFSSKEEAFGWAARSLIEQSCEDCLAKLADSGALRERIVNAVHSWIGQYVDLLKAAPHSAEIVAMVSDVSSEEADLATARIRLAMTDALNQALPDISQQQAETLAFTIHMIAKGLLGAAGSSAEYRQELERIIGALPLD